MISMLCAVVSHIPPLPPLDLFYCEYDSRVLFSRQITKHTRVAVVGSSGNLLNRGLGAEIDAHDAVIRINAAATQRYESDVGNQTDTRFVHTNMFHSRTDKDSLATTLKASESVVMTCPHRNGPFRTPCEAYCRPELATRLQLSAVVSNKWAAWLNDHTLALPDKYDHFPSTGFVALAVAAVLAKMVGAQPPTIYGFGDCEPCPKYYACNASAYAPGATELAYHRFNREAEVRLAWHKAGLIRLQQHAC